jgi:hypothetical protein
MSITFEKPETLNEESEKPLVNENADFPLASIDHRRFEKLTYWIYKKEIESGSWKGIFDDIQLMLGVNDGGRDCALFHNKTMVGVIQCKHSEKDTLLARPAFHKEVIKFCLYHIKLKGLIPNVKNFTYYIASSSGFNEECMKLINNFNTEAVSEPNLKKWTEGVIKKYASIDDLLYVNIETELKALLSELQVKPINNQDINIILNKSIQIDAQKAFFSIRTVVDTSALTPIIDTLEKLAGDKTDTTGAISAFKNASSYLINWKDYISEEKKVHIPRNQVTTLFNWIKGNVGPTEQPLALLTGTAGSGKTVVMKDLFSKLEAEGFVTLGIKADKYYADNIEGLEKRLDIREPIFNLIHKIKEDNEKIVVLIDQIDALSQSLSSDRKPLTTYNLLIQKLIALPGVRVVVSVREFDLNYDPELRIYKKVKKVQLGLLSDEEVKAVLEQLNIDARLISTKLFNTLKTPHHLEVFSNIYSRQLNLEGLVELQDLYQELWKQKILGIADNSPANKAKCIELIYAIADDMMKEQKISLNYVIYQNKFENEIQYLTSQNILVVSNNDIQFFHQTFYDYAYARNFVEKNEPLIQFLLESNQSLHIRSSLKMILSYLRVLDAGKYISAIEQCFTESKIRFHLRLLIINLLGFTTNVLEAEKRFVTTFLLKDKKYRRLFIESVFGESWVTFLIENNTLNETIHSKPNRLDRATESWIYKKLRLKSLFLDRLGYKSYEERRTEEIELFFGLLHRALPEGRLTVANYLLAVKPFEEEKRLIPRLIYSIKLWDHLQCFQLYEKYRPEIESETFGFCHILEDVIPYNINWVIGAFETWMDKVILNPGERNDNGKLSIDYSVNKLFEAIIKAYPEQGSKFGLSFLRKSIALRKIEYKDPALQLYQDWHFYYYDYNKDRHGGVEEIYTDVIEAIERLARNKAAYFDEFIVECTNENSTSILNLLVWGFLANPAGYTKEITEFIVWFNAKKGFFHYEKLNFWIRKLLTTAYPLLKEEQKAVIRQVGIEIISNEKPVLYRDNNGKPEYFPRSFGSKSYEYLNTIPEEDLIGEFSLKKRYQELKRKFGVREDEEVNVIRISGVYEPLRGNAYEKMDAANWQNSMIKYNNDDFDPFSVRGSMLEHSRKFQDETKKNPQKYFPIVENMIDAGKVHVDYLVKGIEGLKEANYNPSEVKRLFDKLIVRPLDQSNTMYLCWLVDYFIKTQQIDQVLIDFLVSTFRNSPSDGDDSKDPLMKGINSVRGAALDKLLLCADNEAFIEIIFVEAEAAAKDNNQNIRAVLVRNLPYLLRADKKRASKIFMTAIADVTENVLKTSMSSLGYMVHHRFSDLIPFFKKWSSFESIQGDLGGILVNSWLNNYKDSEKVMFELLKKSPRARARAAAFSYTNMFDKKEDTRKKCKRLYRYLLKDKSDEVSTEFERMFFEIEKLPFKQWFPMLKLYYKSHAAKKNPQYFFTYLLKNTYQHPKECLTLISHYNKYQKPNIQHGPYYKEEPINIVLNCYNSFLNTGDKVHVEKSISLFDGMLKTDYLRRGAYSALQLADR